MRTSTNNDADASFSGNRLGSEEQDTEVESPKSDSTAMQADVPMMIDEKPHPSACIFVARLAVYRFFFSHIF